MSVGFFKATYCERCPYMNRGYDENSCNLGYELQSLWTIKKELVSCSKGCKLDCVLFGDEMYEKETVIVTDISPNNWEATNKGYPFWFQHSMERRFYEMGMDQFSPENVMKLALRCVLSKEMLGDYLCISV